jgi:hypothetical protein
LSRIPEPAQATPRYLVGVDYLVSYPEDFQSSMRRRLLPPQGPALGEYDLADLQVMEAHINLAALYGIDFFVLHHPGLGSPQELRLRLFPQASNIGDIRFCLSLPAADLVASQGKLSEMLSELARTHFDHPSYLRVEGRPALILRDSQSLQAQLVAEVGKTLAGLGQQVFLIAEQPAWDSKAQADRSGLFDALRPGLPSGLGPERSGYGASSALFADLTADLQALRQTAGVPVLPTIWPGLNARGTLPPSLLQPGPAGILPRSWSPQGPATGTLDKLLHDYGLPSVESRLPILFIDSWNDWKRDTAIEPLRPAPPTDQDDSGRQLYTGGFEYSGDNVANLELVRHGVVAIHGWAMDKESGYPLVGAAVGAWSEDGKLVAVDHADSVGRFALSRWSLKPGDYRVGITYRESVEVTVDSRTATRVVIRGAQPPPRPEPEPSPSLDPLFPELASDLPSPSGSSVLEVAGLKLRDGPQSGPLREALSEGRPWQPEIAGLLDRLLAPGQTVVDVDAGVGLPSLLAARMVGQDGKVYAFDPEPANLVDLLENAKLNGVTNLHAYRYDLGARAGWRTTTSGTLAERRTLDSLSLPNVALLHIGKADHAVDVLAGAEGLLRRSRPIVLLPRVPDPQLPELLSVLSAAGYRAQPADADYLLATPVGDGPQCTIMDFGTQAVRDLIDDGFSQEEVETSESHFVWSDEAESMVYLPLRRALPEPYVLGLRARAFGPLAPVGVRVMLNGAPIGDAQIAATWTGVEIPVPQGLLVEGYNTLLFRYGKIGRPRALVPGSQDDRALSVALDKVWLCPAQVKL